MLGISYFVFRIYFAQLVNPSFADSSSMSCCCVLFAPRCYLIICIAFMKSSRLNLHTALCRRSSSCGGADVTGLLRQLARISSIPPSQTAQNVCFNLFLALFGRPTAAARLERQKGKKKQNISLVRGAWRAARRKPAGFTAVSILFM